MRKPVHIATTVTVEKEKVERMVNNAKHLYPSSPDFLDRKIEFVTADLHDQHGLSNHLHRIPMENALLISDYIIAMKTEINPSANYRGDSIGILYTFSKYHENKSFRNTVLTIIYYCVQSLLF